MLKKINNSVKIEGYLYALDDGNGRDILTKKETGPNSTKPGTEYISGTMLVAVDEEGMNIIPVHFTYITKTYSSGKENKNYAILEKLINEDKTWSSVGKDAATKVHIDASVGLNEFYGQDGTLTSMKRCEGSFINIVNGTLKAPTERNIFATDMIILKAIHVDADEEKDIVEHFNIKGFIFDFRGALLPVDYVIKSADGIKYFENADISEANPLFTKVNGILNFSSVEYKEKEETAFGEPLIKIKTRRTREWLAVSMAKIAYEYGDENGITVEEFTQKLQDREVHLAEIKRRADEYAASKNAVPSAPAKATPTAAVNKGVFNF